MGEACEETQSWAASGLGSPCGRFRTQPRDSAALACDLRSASSSLPSPCAYT